MTLSRHTSHVYFFLRVGWRLLLLYFFFSNAWIAFLVPYFVNALKPPNAAAFPPAAKAGITAANMGAISPRCLPTPGLPFIRFGCPFRFMFGFAFVEE